MKKIAIDLTSLDDNFSGIERFALETTKSLLLNKNYYYILIFKNRIYDYFKDVKYDNCDLFICNGGKLLVNQIKLPKIIKKIKPDIVYFPAFPPSSFFRRNKKIKYISMIHDLVAWDCPDTMKFKSRCFFKVGIKHALKISSIISVNSEFTKKRIIEKFNYKGRIVVTPCASNICLDKNRTFEEVKEKYNLPDKYFLSLGTLEPRKNFDGLIKYFSDYLDKNEIKEKLVIVGRKGWLIEKKLNDFSIENNVIFTGFVDDSDLFYIYNGATAFLFASIYEGFGIPVLESIKCNTLPIVSKIPSNIELLGENYPFYFDFESESFGKTLNYFQNYNQDDLYKLQEKLKDDLQKYNWDYSGDILLKAIDELQ